MDEIIDEELQDKIESYENDLEEVENDIQSCMTRAQTLDIERKQESGTLEKLQKKRKKIEDKIRYYKEKAGVKQ